MTTPYPGPRSVLVLDNARIHHSQQIEDLVHDYGMLSAPNTVVMLILSVGCRIEFLPPYSPDFNPIEQAFSVIKSHLRRDGISCYNDNALFYEMYCSCELITAEMTWGFFRHLGYI